MTNDCNENAQPKLRNRCWTPGGTLVSLARLAYDCDHTSRDLWPPLDSDDVGTIPLGCALLVRPKNFCMAILDQ